MRTRSNDSLFEFIGRDVIYGLSFFARIIDRSLHLNGRHFLLQVRRAILAETAFSVPTICINPVTETFTFMEVRFGFLDRSGKSIIVCLLPTCRTNIACRVRRTAKHAAEKIAGGIQRAGHSSKCRCLKCGLVAITATVTVELELKARICAEITIITSELNQRHESTSTKYY